MQMSLGRQEDLWMVLYIGNNIVVYPPSRLASCIIKSKDKCITLLVFPDCNKIASRAIVDRKR